jgi:hypothetical protein
MRLINNIYSPLNIIRVIRWEAGSGSGSGGNCLQNIRTSEKKISLRKPRHRCKDNIKVVHCEIGCEFMD